MIIDYALGENSVVLRMLARDTASAWGAGKTGITHATAGLRVSVIADSESTPTVYTSAASTLETIPTLGLFSAPSANKARIRELDPVNHAGIVEIQLTNARFGVAGSRSLLITVSGVAGMADCHAVIPLRATAWGIVSSVTGNVVGSVGSVAGNVGGSVGSVAGNVVGNVVGSVGSVAGSVGSVLGDVGGNVVGTVGSLTAGGVTSVLAGLFGYTVETGATFLQSVRLQNAAAGGKSNGLDTTTAKYRDLADAKDRITATVDANGNRTAVTRDLS